MNLFELPVDQYQRYRITADIIGAICEEHGKFKILEVGGYPPRLDKFLPDEDVLITDIASMTEKPSGHGKTMKADALSMPFGDRSFDVVVGVDVLEHIEPDKRAAFVNELTRVSDKYIIIAAPFHDDKCPFTRQETLLFDFIKEAHGYEHKYFYEHLRYGLPSIRNTTDILQDKLWDTFILPNGYFMNWFLTILLEYTAEFNSALKNILPKLREYYNYNFHKSDNREPAYRYVIVACKGEFSNDEKESFAQLISSEPVGQMPPMEYAASLIELARINAQNALQNQIVGLKHDLDARDEEIKHLKLYIEELEVFNRKVKSSLPYQIFEKIFKK